MKSSCALCGGEIIASGVCVECGNVVTGKDLAISPPVWGELKIQYNLNVKLAQDLIEKLSEKWSYLETKTTQKLFPKQSLSDFFKNGKINLIATKESYEFIKEVFIQGQASVEDVISFSPISLEEVYALRDEIKKQ